MGGLKKIGLCCGTVLAGDFRTLAESAGKAGFGFISLWAGLFYDALEKGLNEQDMRLILDDNGLSISELDPLCSWLPPTVDENDIAAGFYAYDEADFFRMADALGARTLNVIQAGPEAVPNGQVIDSLTSLCERAQHHGLIVSVEFLPWSQIGNLGQALELVNATGQANCGVNIDTWHHFRSGGTIEQLAALNPASVAAIQLNDVAARPWDNILEETALGRLLPGEGCSNSAGVLKAFEQAGVEVPINIEVFSSELQQLSPEQVALEAAASMHRVMAQAKRL